MAAGLAHDILNPVAGLAGAIDVLAHELPDDHPRQEMLLQMRSELERIQEILMGLAEYARPKALQMVGADLNATAAKAVEMARLRLREKPIEISLARCADLPPVRHDPMHLSQALMAIVCAGARASSSGERVEMRLGKASGGAAIEIEDGGAVAAGSDLEKMFQPFGAGKQRGAGMALAVAGRVVEAHGGRILARKADSGAGVIVRVELPAEAGAR